MVRRMPVEWQLSYFAFVFFFFVGDRSVVFWAVLFTAASERESYSISNVFMHWNSRFRTKENENMIQVVGQHNWNERIITNLRARYVFSFKCMVWKLIKWKYNFSTHILFFLLSLSPALSLFFSRVYTYFLCANERIFDGYSKTKIVRSTLIYK